MKTKTDILMHNQAFIWLMLATGLVLLVPLVAMQFSAEWDWDVADFMIIGTLLFGTGSLFVLVARKVRNNTHRAIIGLLFLASVLYLWAELAVGIVTNLGS